MSMSVTLRTEDVNTIVLTPSEVLLAAVLKAMILILMVTCVMVRMLSVIVLQIVKLFSRH